MLLQLMLILLLLFPLLFLPAILEPNFDLLLWYVGHATQLLLTLAVDVLVELEVGFELRDLLTRVDASLASRWTRILTLTLTSPWGRRAPR